MSDVDAKTAVNDAPSSAPTGGAPSDGAEPGDGTTPSDAADASTDNKDGKRAKREKKTLRGVKGDDSAKEPPDDDYDPQLEQRLHDLRQEGVHLFAGPGSRGLGANRGTAATGDHSVVAGGNIYYLGDTGPGRPPRFFAVQLSRETLLQLPEYYVAGASDGNDATSLARLTESLISDTGGLICIRGKRGSGRETLAMRALAEVLGVENVGWVARAADPQRLRPDDLARGRGYVIGLGSVPPYRLEEAVEHARGLASRALATIVLLLAPEVNLPGTVITHLAPDPCDVLRALLVRRDDVDISDEDLTAMAPAKALEDLSLFEISTIALEIGEAVRSHRPYEISGRRKLRRTALEKLGAAAVDPPGLVETGGASGETDGKDDSEVANANAECVQLFRRAFLVSAAIFHGLPLASVTVATNSLAQCLAADDADLAKAMIPFTQPTGALLTWLEADPEIPTADSPLDPVGRRTVRLRKPEMADVVLEVVWNEYHLVGEALLGWLHRLATGGVPGMHKEFELQLRAAQAVGRLAVYDYAAVNQRIHDWIEGSAAGRRAAGLAAQVVLADARTGPAFAREVSSWTQRAFAWRQVALLVYSRTLDEARLPDALKLLRYVAPQELHAWSFASAAVVAKILDQPGGMDHVFALLREWNERIESAPPRDIARRRSATAALGLTVARCLLLVGDDVSDNLRAELHRSSGIGDERWKLFVWAWTLALTRSEVFGAGWRLLGQWIVRSDADADFRVICRRLLTALRRHPRIRIKLAFYADVWRAGWKPPRLESERLLADLLVPLGAHS